MEKKINDIQDFQAFVKDFNQLLKDKPRTMFKCGNKEFEEKYSVYHLNLKKFYKFVTGANLQSKCGSDWLDKYFEIRNLTLQNLIDMSNVEHKIKKDSRVYSIDNVFISWQTKGLSNEVCQKIYDKYGAAAFDYFDKEWKSKEQLTAKVFTDVTTKHDLKSFFKPEFFPIEEEKPIEEVKPIFVEPVKAKEPTEPKPKKKAAPRKRSPKTKK